MRGKRNLEMGGSLAQAGESQLVVWPLGVMEDISTLPGLNRGFLGTHDAGPVVWLSSVELWVTGTWYDMLVIRLSELERPWGLVIMQAWVWRSSGSPARTMGLGCPLLGLYPSCAFQALLRPV